MTPQSAGQKTETPVLPKDTDQAVLKMKKVVESLLALLEREAHALAIKDTIQLAVIDNEKGAVAEEYQALSKEFAARLNEFRGVDQSKIQELETLQIKLKDQAQANMSNMDRIGVLQDKQD